jgi:hypothetical protein
VLLLSPVILDDDDDRITIVVILEELIPPTPTENTREEFSHKIIDPHLVGFYCARSKFEVKSFKATVGLETTFKPAAKQ